MFTKSRNFRSDSIKSDDFRGGGETVLLLNTNPRNMIISFHSLCLRGREARLQRIFLIN